MAANSVDPGDGGSWALSRVDNASSGVQLRLWKQGYYLQAVGGGGGAVMASSPFPASDGSDVFSMEVRGGGKGEGEREGG